MNQSAISPEMERQVNQQVRGPADSLVEYLAERLGAGARAAAVYGTPVEREGITVIPVAKVRYGFGAGGGTGRGGSEGGEGSGSGGGGGAIAAPVGYIAISDGTAEFHRIRPTPPIWAVPLIILAAGATAASVLRGLRAIIRG